VIADGTCRICESANVKVERERLGTDQLRRDASL
jgi:hypothetical protein